MGLVFLCGLAVLSVQAKTVYFSDDFESGPGKLMEP